MLFPLGIWPYLIGGLIIGVGVSFVYILTGIHATASTLFSSTWSYISNIPFFQRNKFKRQRDWRLVLAIGMISGSLLYAVMFNRFFITQVQPWRLILGGLLVGIGTRISSGCTSGHGICGLASWSLPSLGAVVTFLVTAIGTALLVQSLGVLP